MGAHLRGYARRKWLRHEILETRSMLAGDVSAWQHPLDPNDLNDDGTVSPADALAAINAINSGGVGELAAKFAPPALRGLAQGAVADFLDSTGDGHLSASDALSVINAINSRSTSPAIRDLPLVDEQPDELNAETLDEIPTILEDRSFAKVVSAINEAGDVDFFRIIPTRPNLNISLFSVGRQALTVELWEVTSTGPALVEEGVSTEEGSRHRAKLDVTVAVAPDKEYFVKVSGVEDATGIYALAVLNYSDQQFRPIEADVEGGDFGDTTDDATPLPLQNGVQAHVRGRLEEADADVFEVAAKDGKLIVHASGEVPLIIEVTKGGEPVVGDLLPSPQRFVATVTEGTYHVSVRAAEEGDTGSYRLHIVNPPIPRTVPTDPAAAIDALFGRLDVNDDNVLSKQEARPAMPAVLIPLIERVFNNWDENENGELDIAEFKAAIQEIHRRAPVQEPVRDFFDRLRR